MNNFPFQPLGFMSYDRYAKCRDEIKERRSEIEDDPGLEYKIIMKYLTGCDFEKAKTLTTQEGGGNEK